MSLTTADECGRLRGVRQPHAFYQWSDWYDRCIWCGRYRARKQPAITVAPPPATPLPLSSACCPTDSSTLEVAFPRPVTTERHDDRTINDIEQRFALLQCEYEATTQLRINHRGNT